MNHSWKHDGDRGRALARACELCGAAGRRYRTSHGATRWETRLADELPWVTGRVPPCPVRREGSYVPVHVLLERRLKSEGIVPEEADLALEHLPGDWRRRSAPERPAWLARWDTGDGPRMIFSCYPMRRCAGAPELHVQGDQVIPTKRDGEP